MFGRSFKIGKLLGFRIETSFIFVVLLGIVMISYGFSSGMAGVLGVLLMTTLLFGSVLLHELGHAVVARRFGIHILGIELHPLGGAAKMAQPPRSAREEIVVAVAGPAVSFVLGVVSYVLALTTGLWFLGVLALINFMLGIFNLLPALPMDGGRVLRALLSERMGRYRATIVAATVAQGLALTMVILGIVQYVRPVLMVGGVPLSGFSLIFVGLLVWLMAAQERALAGRWRYQDEAPETQVLDQDGRVIFDPYASPSDSGAPPSPVGHHWPPHQGNAGSPGLVRRVVRLPNGMVLVVEEYVRW